MPGIGAGGGLVGQVTPSWERVLAEVNWAGNYDVRQWRTKAFADTAGTTPAVVGGNVARLDPGQSGMLLPKLEQASASIMPVLTADGGLQFVGNKWMLANRGTGNGFAMTNFTSFLVFKATWITSAFDTVAGLSGDTWSGTAALNVQYGDYVKNSGQDQFFVNGRLCRLDGANAVITTGTIILSLNNQQTPSLVQQCKFNGRPDTALGATGTFVQLASMVAQKFAVGAKTNGTNTVGDMTFYQYLLTTEALGATQELRITQALANKFGVTL